MKRIVALTILVVLLAAACAPAASDEPATGQETTPNVTVFRPPT